MNSEAESESLIPKSIPDNSKSSKSSEFLVQSKSLVLSWENISYEVKTSTKPLKILKSVSGLANSGQMLAILGESGSGKTSLLSILSGRTSTKNSDQISGKVKLNTTSINDLDYSLYSSYLPQKNIYFSYLTPREALIFAATLKIQLSKKKIKRRVDKILRILKIDNVADSIIGDELVRGLSGGEKKRVCIAIELVSSPSVILMDEPVSGLDSYTADIVIGLLRELANKGKMIIVSIHQPSDLLYSKFDRLIFMQEGNIVYQGSRMDCPKYFEEIGMECPKHSNPGESIVKQIHIVDRNSYSERELSMMKTLNDHYKLKHLSGDINSCQKERVDPNLMKYRAGFGTQFYELTKRGFRAFIRNPLALLFKIANTIVFGTLVALMFWDLDTDSVGVNNRAGLLQCGVFNSLYFPIFVGAFLIPLERDIVHKEFNDRIYSIEAYILSKLVVELPMNIFFAVGLNSIVYYTTNLNTTESDKFFMAILILLLCQINGVTLGLIAGGLSNSVFMSSFLGPTFSTPLIVFSGFFSDVDSIPKLTRWAKYASPYYYGYQAMLNNEFDGLDVDDDVYPGPYTRFGIDRNIRDYVLMFLVNIVCTILIGYGILKLRAVRSKYIG